MAFHDIALLKVASDHPGVPVLPLNFDLVGDTDINRWRQNDNITVRAAGWGYEEDPRVSRSIELRVANIPLLNRTEIESFLDTTDYVYDDGTSPAWTDEDAENLLYAGHFHQSGPESCNGDSGGALWVQQNHILAAIGSVVSGYGEESDCGRAGYAGFYSRLSQEKDFLVNHLGLGILNQPERYGHSSWAWQDIDNPNAGPLPVSALISSNRIRLIADFQDWFVLRRCLTVIPASLQS